MKVIGLCGKMGVGKDYIANNFIIPFIQNNLKMKCILLSFADQMKVNVMTKNNVSFDSVFVNKNQHTRSMLQREGTEQGRNIHGSDIWIKYFHNWTQVFAMRGFEAVVCCDVRFKNEIDYIRSYDGLLIRVCSPKRNRKRLNDESKGNPEMLYKLTTHSSECELDQIADDQFDIVINNDFNSSEDMNSQLQRLYECIEKKLLQKC